MRVGAKPTVCIEIGEKELKMINGKVEHLFKSKVRNFKKSGGYIPISNIEEGRHVLVLVLEDGIEI